MTIKVCLLWHSFSSGNLGVGALSVCNLELLEEQFTRQGLVTEYLVVGNGGHMGYTPSITRKIDFVEFSKQTFLRNPVRLVKEIASCDLIFDIGEGDSFSDIYGFPRFLKMALGKLVAHAFKIPLIMSPQTIGPFNSTQARWLARKSMNPCRKVVARDDESFAVLSEMGVMNKQSSIDVAFALPFLRTTDTTKSLPKVGLNVSGLLYNGGYSRDNQFGLSVDYKELVHRLIETFLGLGNTEVHMVPHVISRRNAVEDDYKVAQQLKLRYPDVILPEAFSSPGAAKSYIAGLDFFLGARMHSTIAALSAGVPVIPLAYSRKFSGLFSSIGYQHIIDLKSVDLDAALDVVNELYSRRAELVDEVQIAVSAANRRLDRYKDCLAEVIEDCVGV